MIIYLVNMLLEACDKMPDKVEEEAALLIPEIRR
jgi:hypothetical protein